VANPIAILLTALCQQRCAVGWAVCPAVETGASL